MKDGTKKDEILRATARLISKKGIGAASTREICAAVGITAPTLYHHFSDKADLLNAVTSYAFDRHLKHIHFENSKSRSLKNIKEIWTCYFQFVDQETELYVNMIHSLAAGKILASGKICFEKLVESFRVHADAGELLVGATEAATVYLAAAQGFALVRLSRPGNARLALLNQKIRDRTLRSLFRKFDENLKADGRRKRPFPTKRVGTRI